MALNLLDTMRTQVAVYWPPAGPNDEGQQGYGAASEVLCRWMDTSEMFTGPGGQTQLAKSKVYVQDILVENGVLWLSPILRKRYAPGAAIASLADAANPFANLKASRIQRFDSSPTFDGTQAHRVAWL